MRKKIVVGTRGSKLALTQTEMVVNSLRNLFPEIFFEIKIIKTKGDVFKKSLKSSPERGLFTKEIEKALLYKKIDMAVHSFKDMEVDEMEGLMIGAIPEREDMRDVLITKDEKKFSELKEGAIIGTGSPRRISQLERFGFKFKDIRGNVDTRLKKLYDGEYDGIVLALSGLKRLGMIQFEKFALPLDVMIPSPGQGALSIEIREEDAFLKDLLDRINHKESEIGAKFEKEFLKKMGGGCHLPIGAFCEVDLGRGELKFLAFFEEKGVKYRSEIELEYNFNLKFDDIYMELMSKKEEFL